MQRTVITFDAHDRISGVRVDSANNPVFHIHLNADPKAKVHEWACNSPYCENVGVNSDPHPDDGGPEAVMQGREPWRGGSR